MAKRFSLSVVSMIFAGLLAVSLPVQAASTKKADEDLVYQANFGNGAEVNAVLARGANPNAKSAEGWPAISLAASRGDADAVSTVDALIAGGAEVNVRDPNGETPLMNAIVANQPDMVRFLVEHGADFGSISANGRTVLQFAEYYGDTRVVSIIKAAIQKEQDDIRDGKSQHRFQRMLTDFIYNHCVLQYAGYNLGTSFYKTAEATEAAKKLQQDAIAKIMNAQTELERNFQMRSSYTKTISDGTQALVYNELEALISNRNRRNNGVGTEADMQERCNRIVNVWRKNYAGFESGGAPAPATGATVQ